MENQESGQEFEQSYAPDKQTPEHYKVALSWEIINRLAKNHDEAQLVKSYGQLKNLNEAL